MDNWEITLVETEARSKSNLHRINELAREHEAIHELAISVKEIAVNTQAIQRELTQQGAKIEALEKLPAQRWHTMVKALVTTCVSTLAGGVIGAVLALILK